MKRCSTNSPTDEEPEAHRHISEHEDKSEKYWKTSGTGVRKATSRTNTFKTARKEHKASNGNKEHVYTKNCKQKHPYSRTHRVAKPI